MARFIPDDVLENIKLRADITEVVQTYVPTLKKMGNTWKACCPFHQEKTPSFTVSPERGTFKCFGCGKGGNVFSFVMEMEKLDFPEAVEQLARKYGIAIPEPEPFVRGGKRSWYGEKNGSGHGSVNPRTRLYDLHEKLAAWYARQLWENPETEVAKYFATRQIPKETAVRFQIGASPDSWDAAIRFLRQNGGFTDEELKLAGVVSFKEETPDRIYDRFRNRLMFPIRDEQGRVIAFSARSVEADPKGWKYMNSPETPIFKKSRTLYALDFARKSIPDIPYVVLCEGQLDVIAMHRAGCTTAVAPQGTAFGAEQASVLKRYTDTICLAPDNDKAGRTAVLKDAEILLPMGFRLKTAVYPGAKDADELLKTQGPEVLKETVEKAGDFFEFAFRIAGEGCDLASPAGKAKVAASMSKWLRLIDDPVTLDVYAAWLAEKLGTDKNAVMMDVQRHQQIKQAEQEKREYWAEQNRNAAAAAVPEPVKKEFSEQHSGVRDAYYMILKLILDFEELAAEAVNDLESDMLDSTPAGKSVELVIQAQMNGEWEEARDRILMMTAERNISDARLSEILLPADEENGETPALTGNERKNYQSCLTAVRNAWMSDRRKFLIEKARLLPDDSPEKLALIQESIELTRKLFSKRS